MKRRGRTAIVGVIITLIVVGFAAGSADAIIEISTAYCPASVEIGLLNQSQCVD